MSYRLWQDFNLLVALFAMVGLALSVFSWENEFHNRNPKGITAISTDFLTELIVLLVSIMGSAAIIGKYYFEAVW